MIATNHPHAVATGGDGAYHDNFGIFDGPANQNGLFAFVHYLLGVRQASCALKQRKYADLKIETGNDVTYEFRREDGKAHLCEGNRCVWLRIDGSAVGDNGLPALRQCLLSARNVQFSANGQERQWHVSSTRHTGRKAMQTYGMRAMQICLLLEPIRWPAMPSPSSGGLR